MSGKKPENAWHNVRGVTYEELRHAEETVLEKYGDIINAARPDDPSRRKASANSRAAQFLPFAALTGFDDEIAEEGRLTEKRIELSDEQKEQIDRTIRRAAETIQELPEVTAVIFAEDPLKEGGAYVTMHGRLKKIDSARGELVFTDKTRLPADDLMYLYLHEEEENGE